MKKYSVGRIIISIIFIIMSILFVIPFVLLISISLSNEIDIGLYGYRFIPLNLDLAAYEFLMKNPMTIIDAYKVTIGSAVIGTALSVFLMSLIAYPLSKKGLKGRNGISFFVFFTMLFSGGLVPSYILITQYLHLDDTFWVYIFPSLINAWNIFLLRTFFTSIPSAIIESAYLDGASEFRIFLTFILPLSTPVLATVALMGALGRWNDWFTSMLYINDPKLVTLQYLLQKILLNMQLLQQEGMSLDMLGIKTELPAETVRMAMAVIAAGPMLLVFPFFQQYFVKGLTIGSVKG